LPPGYERLTIEDARKIPNIVKEFVSSEWDTVALKNGRIFGYGYQNMYGTNDFYAPTYGLGVSQTIVIKKSK